MIAGFGQVKESHLEHSDLNGEFTVVVTNVLGISRRFHRYDPCLLMFTARKAG